MNRIYAQSIFNSTPQKAFKIMLMVLLFIHTASHVNAQVQLISAYDGGFEAASTDFIGNGWTTVQGADNRIWRVGSAASSSSGTNSAYTGNVNNYNGLNLERVNHFYRDIAIPAGATNVNLSFYYRQPTIDNTYDFFYVSVTTIANTPQQNVVPGANYTVLFSNTANTYANYTLIGPLSLTAYAGTTVRLVFSAKSDGIAPVANPALDNVSLTYIPSGYNMGVASIVAPIIPACYSANETIRATIVNSGNVDLDLTVHPLTINASIAGPNAQTFNPIVLSTGIYAAGSNQTLIISNNYDMSASGTYVLTVSSNVLGDASTNNDTLTTSFIKYANPLVAVTPNSAGVCEGDSILVAATSQTVTTPLNYTNATLFAIPNSSPAGINSPIVSQAPTPANSIISCTVNINHTYVGDLILKLIAPNGSSVILATQLGAGGDNYTGTVFSDNASIPIASGSAPFTGMFNPEQAFSNLTGSAFGTWSLNVADMALLDAGSLASWSISFPSPQGIASYTWSPSSGLSSSSIANPMVSPNTNTLYTVTLTDNLGCTASGTSDIQVHTIYTENQSITLCQGDSIVVGTSTYTASGTYSDILHSVFGCDSIVSTNLTVLQPIAFAQTVTLCAGSTLTVGNSTYSVAGVYTDVLPSAFACDSVVTSTLIFNQNIFTTQTLTICNGDSVLVGSNYYAVAGVFIDTLTSNVGCDSIATTSLIVNPLPLVSLAQFTDPICDQDAPFQLTGGSPSLGTYSGNGVTGGDLFDPALAGIGDFLITYTVADTNNCLGSDSQLITVTACTGTVQSDLNNALNVYPNPSKGIFTVQLNNYKSSLIAISIVDVTGKEVYQSTLKNTQGNWTLPIDIARYSKGVYLLKVFGDNDVALFKLIVE